MFFFLFLYVVLFQKKKQTSVIRLGANFHFEHFATYMLACIYVTDWLYIHACMQTESKLKKHEFRVIYIIAKKNCTIF